MSISINGTTGISGVDGSASTPALQGSDTNTGISFGTDTVTVNTNGTARVTVDASGNLGVGTASPAANLHVSAASSEAVVRVTNTGANSAWLVLVPGSSGQAYIHNEGNTPTIFTTNGTERVRIDASGQIMLGGGVSGTQGTFTVIPNYSTGSGTFIAPTPLSYWNRTASTNTGTACLFQNTGNTVGSITYTNTATAYNTSSDYRLKENITAVSDGIARLQQLKPSRFNFIGDPDRTVDGFIAHEVQSVVPEAVTGTKDEVDADGEPLYQGIDQSKLVPLLTAALQESITRIEALEAEVQALKGGN